MKSSCILLKIPQSDSFWEIVIPSKPLDYSSREKSGNHAGMLLNGTGCYSKRNAKCLRIFSDLNEYDYEEVCRGKLPSPPRLIKVVV